MGSIGAMKARSFSKDRYFQGERDDVAQARARGHRGPRAVQGPARGHRLPARRRPAAGDGLLRRARRSRSCATSARFVRVTAAGLRESHPHDVSITKESPNYRVGAYVAEVVPLRDAETELPRSARPRRRPRRPVRAADRAPRARVPRVLGARPRLDRPGRGAAPAARGRIVLSGGPASVYAEGAPRRRSARSSSSASRCSGSATACS